MALAAQLGLGAIALIAFRLGRREARALRSGGSLPAARLCPASMHDRMRVAAAAAADLSHALSVAVGLASLAGTALAVALLALG